MYLTAFAVKFKYALGARIVRLWLIRIDAL